MPVQQIRQPRHITQWAAHVNPRTGSGGRRRYVVRVAWTAPRRPPPTSRRQDSTTVATHRRPAIGTQVPDEPDWSARQTCECLPRRQTRRLGQQHAHADTVTSRQASALSDTYPRRAVPRLVFGGTGERAESGGSPLQAVSARTSPYVGPCAWLSAKNSFLANSMSTRYTTTRPPSAR